MLSVIPKSRHRVAVEVPEVQSRGVEDSPSRRWHVGLAHRLRKKVHSPAVERLLLLFVTVTLISGYSLRPIQPKWVCRTGAIGGVQVRVVVEECRAESIHDRRVRPGMKG